MVCLEAGTILRVIVTLPGLLISGGIAIIN